MGLAILAGERRPQPLDRARLRSSLHLALRRPPDLLAPGDPQTLMRFQVLRRSLQRPKQCHPPSPTRSAFAWARHERSRRGGRLVADPGLPPAPPRGRRARRGVMPVSCVRVEGRPGGGRRAALGARTGLATAPGSRARHFVAGSRPCATTSPSIPIPQAKPVAIDVVELPSGALKASIEGRPVDVDVIPLGVQLSVRVDGKVVDLTIEGSPPEIGAVASGHRSYVRVESERMRAAALAKKSTSGGRGQARQEPHAGRVVKVARRQGRQRGGRHRAASCSRP